MRTGAPKSLDTMSRAWAEQLNGLWLAQSAKTSETPEGSPEQS